MDVSQSMSTAKMNHARNLVHELFQYHLHNNDDAGVISFGSEIHKLTQIMPKHVIEIDAQLAKLRDENHVEDKRKLFDAISLAYRCLAFRKLAKMDHKEQYVVLFTDYKGKARNMDGDASVSAEERAAHDAWLYQQRDVDGDGVVTEKEMLQSSLRGNEEHSSEGGEAALHQMMNEGNVFGAVTLLVVHVTDGVGKEGEAERAVVNRQDNALHMLSNHHEHVHLFMMEDAVDKITELWAESQLMQFKDIVMETFQ